MRALWILLAALAIPAAAADREVARSTPADPDVHVEISNVAGSVSVIGWDRSEVEISGTLGPGVEELRVDGDRRHLEIEVELLERSGRNRGGHAFLTIHLPRGARLELSTVSAGCEISEATGAIEVESVSGSIRIGAGSASVNAETVSGVIEIDRVAGAVQVASVSGSVTVRGATGRLEAATVSGTLEISGEELTSGELEAVSGSIRFEGSLAEQGRLAASSHSGDVVLSLPADSSALFDLSSFSGSIANGLGPAPAKRRHGPGSELSFRLGSGSARVSAESFSGDVTLRPR